LILFPRKDRVERGRKKRLVKKNGVTKAKLHLATSRSADLVTTAQLT